MPAGPTKVLYIAGMGRSGTTLVDVAMGQLDGFCSVGELRNLWERGLASPGWPCGCGTAVSECAFWVEVLHGAFAPKPVPPAAEMLALQRRSVRTRHLPRLWRSSPVGGSGPVPGYAAVLGRLYASIAAVSGGRVVVDSSKHPADAWVASALEGIDLRVVHVVRDPRGVAFSWARTKPTPEPGGVMVRHGPLHSSNRWLAWNAFLAGALRRRLGPRYLLMRYEDLMADPRRSLQAVLDLVGEGERALPLTAAGRMSLAATHTVSGNPSRFVTGQIELRADEEWRRNMAMRDRLLATVPAVPLMRRYGYALGSGAR